MGNVRSEHFETPEVDPWWCNNTMDQKQDNQEKIDEVPQSSLKEFRKELERKHEKRRQLIAEKRKEIIETKQELEKCRKEIEEYKKINLVDLKEENEELKVQLGKIKLGLIEKDDIVAKNKELRISIAEMQAELQLVNSQLVCIEQERLEYTKHVSALKDVVRVTKDMLEIRDNQITELKQKVKAVEEILTSNEMKFMSDGLREEYEKQLRNIRNLRAFYEERQRIDRIEKQNLREQASETKKLLEDEQKKTSELEARISEVEEDNSKKYDDIASLRSNLGLSKAESKELQAEISIVNQLFSETLLGFNNSQGIDLDALIKSLEENHDLLTKFANEEGNPTAAALPKLLLDLISQIDKDKEPESKEGQAVAIHQFNSAEEIVENLPKVWKILIELLSHQNPPLNVLSAESGDPCYKSVETPTGPKLKLSVSQTFIRLKDLILEKKFLERETYRLKHLNTHLESRLQDQEKRLELVSGEVTKTWHVVGKMQRQHQQLHTHEKVVRYELQQKRKLLVELKEELQNCREKWVLAREKNDTTQEQWKQLRKEFSDRKIPASDDFNHSAESGYSDDKDSSDDERGYETDDEAKIKNKTEFLQQSDFIPTDELTINKDKENVIDVTNLTESNKDGIQTNDTKLPISELVLSNNPAELSSDIKSDPPAEASELISKIEINKPTQSTSEYNVPTIHQLIDDKDFQEVNETNIINDYSQLSKPIEANFHVTQQNSTEMTLTSSGTTTISDIAEVTEAIDNTDIQSSLITLQSSNTDIDLLKISTDLVKTIDEVTEITNTHTRQELETEGNSKNNCQAVCIPIELKEINSIIESGPSLDVHGPLKTTDELQQISTEAEVCISEATEMSETAELNQTNANIELESPSEVQKHLKSNDEKNSIEAVLCTSDVTKIKETPELDQADNNEETQSFSDVQEPSKTSVESEQISTDVTAFSSGTTMTNVTTNLSIANTNTEPQSSSCTQDLTKTNDEQKVKRTPDEIFSAREERLKRLEEQCKQLVKKVVNTSQKSIDISNKLDNLHGIYGEASTSRKQNDDSNDNAHKEDSP